MKPLFTVKDIKNLAASGKNILYLEQGTLLTAAAKDAAKDWGIKIVSGADPEAALSPCPIPGETAADCAEKMSLKSGEKCGGGTVISPELVAQIVRNVIDSLPKS